MNYEERVISSLVKRKDMVSVMHMDLGTLFTSHKDIWDFVETYYQTNKEVVPVSVLSERFPDFEYDDSLEGTTKHYVAEAYEQKATADLTSVIAGATKALKSKKISASDLLDHFQKRVAEIKQEAGMSRSVDIRDYKDASKHYERIRELSELHGGSPGIRFGFDYMDQRYPTGMAAGHFMVLMGYSGLGKTWFGIKLMINAWLQGYSPMIINLEMSAEELRDRVYFLISEYTMNDLVQASVDVNNFEAWAEEFMKDKPEFNLISQEGFGDFTVDMVQAKIEQYQPDVLMLDYLSLFTDRGRSNDERIRTKKTARELKQLAQGSKVPILTITAVTGKDKKDRINPPDVAQVAFSSEIEYAANLAFAVHTHRNPVTQESLNTEIVARKNRHGELFSFLIKMDLDNGIIEEIKEEDQVMPEDDLEFLDAD
ncbi:replicative DNA helicase [Rhodococcus phage Weasels2]|uniref:Replicative DNA helicase n=1 Tax=Rhodococcus phage Weasels2 TaxID=1897437 RepID=A0A1I9SA80_9CAUD|nr:replicative DNA helicase [Rhodococcus phage Weasels2]AOZ63686.1 replicative DNA helicase [Rhodococcus phage Weasels2]